MAAARRPAAVMSSVETRWMSSVETGQMSAVETGQMTAAETSGLSQQKTVKKHRVFVCLSSRPPIPFERGEGQCHQVLIFTTTSRTQAPRPDPRTPP